MPLVVDEPFIGDYADELELEDESPSTPDIPLEVFIAESGELILRSMQNADSRS